VNSGMNMRSALALAREIGLEVEDVWRTGEVRVRAPGHGVVRVSRNRKDAPRALTTLIRAVQERRCRRST